MYRLNKSTTIYTMNFNLIIPAGAKVIFAPEGIYIDDNLFVLIYHHGRRRWYLVIDGQLVAVRFPNGGEPYPFAAYRSN
jgi:hypothetical protein